MSTKLLLVVAVSRFLSLFEWGTAGPLGFLKGVVVEEVGLSGRTVGGAGNGDLIDKLCRL